MFGHVLQDCRASIGMLYVLPPGRKALELAVLSGGPWQMAAPWARVMPDDPLPLADAVRRRRAVWVGSQEEMARRYPRLGFVLPYDFVLAAFPVSCGTAVRGGLVLLWPVRHPARPTVRERDAIDAFCRHAGLVMRRAADEGKPVRAEPTPRTLAPLRQPTPDRAEAVAAHTFTERLPVGCCSLDLDGRVTYLNAAAADLLDVDTARLMGSRPWTVLLWLDRPDFEERYRAAVISRRPTTFTAVRPPGLRLYFHLYPDDSGVSVHITALPEESCGDAIAPAVHAPRGAVEAVGAATLYQLMHMAATLSEVVRVKDVVDLVGDQLVPGFEVQGLALWLAEGGRLRILGSRGYSAEFLASFDGQPLTDPTPPAQALTSGSPSFFGSYADFQRAYPRAPRFKDRDAWAFLPLIASGRPIGLVVLSYDHPRDFPTAERAILTSVAGLIAQVLDRARLYDANLNLARTLQAGLLPQALPSIPGLQVTARYLPAGHGTDIGGDFYDLIRCGSQCAAITIGDVQGHNVRAAALMGQVRTAVHAHAAAHTAPGAVLARTNRLIADLNPGLFTSCLYAHLDLVRHNARLATAGHPAPLIRHPDGRTEVLAVPVGILLGVTADAGYPILDIPLPPGTVLVLYTDGLVEAPGTDIDDATDRLAQHLTRAGGTQDVDDLADTLLEHAMPTTPGTDDIALLVARVM
ncbi:SpoIIE family protein phosphatase [Actinacidiphila glaucinigra]|uniref:SpoIIE family protein phosphatase n=1 Tax=Actinacidiphila glaucinigra TaxID=235986 RepID=UPI0033A20720